MCSSIKYFQSQQNDRDIKIDDVLHPGSPPPSVQENNSTHLRLFPWGPPELFPRFKK